MADVIANMADFVAMFFDWQMCIVMWLMLLPLIVFAYLADVIAWWLVLLLLLCSDVFWQMLLPGG